MDTARMERDRNMDRRGENKGRGRERVMNVDCNIV